MPSQGSALPHQGQRVKVYRKKKNIRKMARKKKEYMCIVSKIPCSKKMKKVWECPCTVCTIIVQS